MAPYLLLLASISVGGLVLCERRRSRRRDRIFLLAACAAMFAMSALRDPSVGVDNSLYYLPYFEQVAGSDFSFLWSDQNIYRSEPGYSLLVFLISRISDSPTAFFAIQAMLTIGLTGLLAWRYASSVWVCLFTFVSFGFFGYTMVTLRQQLAICVMLLAVPWLQKRRPIPYLLIVALAASFHKSLWVLVPCYLLAWLPFCWQTLAVYAGGTLILLFFTDPILDLVTRFVYTIYTADNYYRAVGRDIQTAVVPVLLFVVAVLLGRRLLRRNPANLPLIHFSCWSACLFLLTLKSFIFQRLALIFLPVAVLLVPEILNACGPEPDELTEFEQLRSAGKGKKLSARALKQKARLRDDWSMYYSALCFILFVGWMYYLFLLVSNRLLLVPYAAIL